MDSSTQRFALSRASWAFTELNLAYKVAATLLLAIIVRRLISRPKPFKAFPVWATIEIAVASYVLRRHSPAQRIYSSLRRYGGSLFGISTEHQILVDLPGVDRLMAQPFHILSAEPVHFTLFTRVFGGINSPNLKGKLENSWKDLLVPVGRLFLNEAAAAAAVEESNVPERAASFVTFSSDPRHMKRWEMSADIRVLRPNLPSPPGMAEANLQSLTRDFGACMAIPLLYGKDLLDGNPQLLDDFWEFDNNLFPLLMIGIPLWAPLRMVRKGLEARSRILAQLEALYRRIDQIQRGQPVDSCWDMSDVSFVPFERNKVYEREGWSFPERAAGHFAVFWGQNANTHPVLFWFLLYIYSTPGLLARVREAIAPFIHLSDTQPRDIISIDHSALARNCQLLRACVFETYRMANEPTSIRYVARSITINDGNLEHKLRPGTWVGTALTDQPRSIRVRRARQVHPRAVSGDGSRVRRARR